MHENVLNLIANMYNCATAYSPAIFEFWHQMVYLTMQAVPTPGNCRMLFSCFFVSQTYRRRCLPVANPAYSWLCLSLPHCGWVGLFLTPSLYANLIADLASSWLCPCLPLLQMTLTYVTIMVQWLDPPELAQTNPKWPYPPFLLHFIISASN